MRTSPEVGAKGTLGGERLQDGVSWLRVSVALYKRTHAVRLSETVST
jgi:hypothetical protein